MRGAAAKWRRTFSMPDLSYRPQPRPPDHPSRLWWALIAVGAFIVCAGFLVLGYACTASLLWSHFSGEPFYGLSWWDALTWWAWPPTRASYKTDLQLVLSGGIPLVFIVALIVMIANSYRNRRAIMGKNMVMWSPPARPWSRQPPAMTHGDAAFADPDEAARRLRR